MKDGCVWCIKEPDGEDILKYMLWSSNPAGVPDVLFFASVHMDKDDLIRDMENTVALYNGILDKRGLKDS